MVKLSIIILSFNTKDLTLQCIESIVKQYKEELEKNKFEIIVVDNNSVDGSLINVKYYIEQNKHNSIKVIKNKENMGFAKGSNIGAKSSLGEYILFLNSDTVIFDRGILKMVEFLDKNKNIGVLGGKLLNVDGSVQSSCGKFLTLPNLFLTLLGLEKIGKIRESPKKLKKVDWVSGACMMIRRSIFEKIGGFDEKLFMYIEDIEICFRIKIQGFVTYVYPDIKLLHQELGSGNRTFAIVNIYKGIVYFYKKHYSYWEYIVAKSLLIAKAAIALFVGTLTQNKNLVATYRKAISF